MGRTRSVSTGMVLSALVAVGAWVDRAQAQITQTYEGRYVEISYQFEIGEEQQGDYRYALPPFGSAEFDAALYLSEVVDNGSASAEASQHSFVGRNLVRARSEGRLEATAPPSALAEACMTSIVDVEFTLDQERPFDLKLDIIGEVSGEIAQLDGDFYLPLDFPQQSEGTMPAGTYRLLLVIESCESAVDGGSVSSQASYDFTLVVEPETCAETLYFPDFGSLGDMIVLGDAQFAAPATLRLTEDASGQSGAAWTPAGIRLAEGFDASFRFQVSPSGLPGDGFAFVLQDEGPFAIGGGGSGMGYSGLTRNVAVEFDTFAFGGEYAATHVSVQTRGEDPNSSDDTASLGHVVLPSTIADGLTHTGRVVYAPGQMQVYLDGTLVLAVNVDLQNIGGQSVLTAEGCARLGFTAATGAATSQHDILSLTLNVRCAAGLTYANFADPGTLRLVGTTSLTGSNRLRLTEAQGDQRGAAWHTDTIRVTDGFQTEFTFEISNNDPAADGLAFVVHTEGPAALGGGGHALGYAENGDQPAITGHLAVALQPHWWSPGTYTVKVESNVDGGGTGVEYSLASVDLAGTISDGQPHHMRITYVPGQMEIYLDGAGPVLTLALDLADVNGGSLLGSTDCVWVGFTGATGGLFASHDILSWWVASGCTSPPPGDYDGDCDVDQEDILAFHVCAVGPAIPYPAGCEGKNFDGDTDVDQADFAFLQRCYSGSGRPADPLCITW